MSPVLQFFQKILRFFAVTFISTVIATLAGWGLMKVWNILEFSQQYGDIWLNYIMLSIQTVIIFGLPVLVCTKLDGDIRLDFKPLEQKRNLWLLLISLLAWIICIVPVNSLLDLNNSISFPERFAEFESTLRNIHIKSNDFIKQFINQGGTFNFIILIIVFAVLPAIFEELFFRGYLQKVFFQYSQKKWLSIIVVAIVFSIFHFDFYAFFPRVFLGVLLGVTFFAARSLWLPIVLHFIHNFTTLIYNRFLVKNDIDLLSHFGTQGLEWVISGFLFFGTIYLFYILLNKSDLGSKSF